MERTREAAPTLRVARWSVPWAWVVFAFALGTGLLMGFVVFRVQSLVDQNTDPYFFGDMGKSIADGNGFEGFGSLITRRAPLYPIVIGGVYAVFGDHQKLIVLLHVLMFSGTCVLAYDMGRRLFNHRTGVIAGFVCALHPMLLRYIPNLHLETQLTLLITLTAWLTIRFYERPTVAAGALVGLASGAAALTKAVALLYPALFVAGIILACRAARRRGEQRPTPWKPILAIFVVMGCLILPWTARNYRSSGHFVLISSGTSDAFLRGFIFTETDYITLRRPPYTDAENASNAYFEALAEAEGTVWERDDYETDQILNKEAKRRLFAEPGPVLRKSVIGVFTFWYQLTSLKNSLLALVLALGAWFFAVIGWRQARREQRPAWLLMLPVLYLNLVLALLLALGRYSVPILPALIVMSAFGVDTLLDRRAARRA
ncbi:MAG: ArnT family glycosyltransferase [Ilumatobacteraceae bacterium]|jgi:4-amino-4-deoxy-L-arabinose transferase-like glycosyltransferase|nr:glycosyltransferase family 39 protein [Ilumatobacteraceae bacterium]HQY83771.1 glycosyltransferase family 39 protein [Ilumatobacteraceae bacterium]